MSNQQESIRSLCFSSEKKFHPSCSSKQVYISLLPVYKFKLNKMFSLSFCKIWCCLYASSLIKHFYHFSLHNIFPHNGTQYKSHTLALPFVGSHTATFLIILHHIRTTLSHSNTLMMREYLYLFTKLHAITSHLHSHCSSNLNIYLFLPTITSCFFMIVKEMNHNIMWQKLENIWIVTHIVKQGTWCEYTGRKQARSSRILYW
jgi:hypothetical protein